MFKVVEGDDGKWEQILIPEDDEEELLVGFIIL